ncbi:MAG: hypothetical protein AAGF01_15955 [Cyanobacteria bacterium P01_G01_bin.38]
MDSPEHSKLSKILFNPIVRNCSITAFSIGAAFGAGLVHGFNGEISSDHVTRVEYERLELQMSLTEVEAILGRGTEVDRSESTTTVIWTNRDGSSIEAIFEGDRMIKKAQSRL